MSTTASALAAATPVSPLPAVADFSELYAREFGVLTRAAHLLVGDWSVAEEIVQGVFADVYRRWSEIGALPNPAAYLHRAVVFRCRSHFRAVARQARRRRVRTSPTPPDPLDELLRTDNANELRRALAMLSRRQYECLVARFFLEQTETETSRQLGISIGAVRTHTRRGLDALQKGLRR